MSLFPAEAHGSICCRVTVLWRQQQQETTHHNDEVSAKIQTSCLKLLPKFGTSLLIPVLRHRRKTSSRASQAKQLSTKGKALNVPSLVKPQRREGALWICISDQRWCNLQASKGALFLTAVPPRADSRAGGAVVHCRGGSSVPGNGAGS